MKSLLYMLAGFAVMGLAFWAYSENYRTQASIDKVERLHREISTSTARMSVLKAEWAYLNRPDRLRDLADMNFPRLELLPLAPEQLGSIDQVGFPAEPLLAVTDPVEVMNRNAEEQEARP